MNTDRPREHHLDDSDEPRESAANPEAERDDGESAGDGGAREPGAASGSDHGSGSGGTSAGFPKRLPWLLVIAAVVLAVDLGTKALVVAKMTPGQPISIIGDVVRLTLIRNSGAAFSMATGMTWLLTLVALAVVVGVIRIGRTLRSLAWAVGLGLVLGGAVGNLVDRLFRAPGPLQGHVIDFIAVTRWWPVFNVADSAIVCGAILLVVLTVFGFEPDGTRSGHGDDDAAEAGE
ncbi:lipoprotein signal peptidase [Nocardia nova SH22a]|uniref:Lipoprotein signal peptidase n=1 Tax=Nocardia nova SH22a TaxID=1415166 RepID=W5TD53_9NOCA|nr:signal peptidase II [Nocardia nova]AHH17182.1 lipoprotein signal peptidase [Nocardia nova SH22a]